MNWKKTATELNRNRKRPILGNQLQPVATGL
jgi:hypothetical protein